MDEADAKIFDIFKKKEKDSTDAELNKTSKIGRGISRDADFYNMNNYRRGKALIFNHYIFDDKSMQKRNGTDVDAKRVKQVFHDLKFDVQLYNDLKYGQIYEIIKEVAAEDHSECDCLAIVVMSHGDKGIIHAKDHQYPPDLLWTPFAGDLCPSLAGKPKLFFIQACRGEELDAGVRIETDSSYDPDTYVLPANADFLIMYSTSIGHYSFRSPSNGSWFIQCLCKELAERAKHQDLLTILTFVNRSMAIEFSSNVPGNQAFHNKKQVGSIVSSLTRLLYFYQDIEMKTD